MEEETQTHRFQKKMRIKNPLFFAIKNSNDAIVRQISIRFISMFYKNIFMFTLMLGLMLIRVILF